MIDAAENEDSVSVDSRSLRIQETDKQYATIHEPDAIMSDFPICCEVVTDK